MIKMSQNNQRLERCIVPRSQNIKVIKVFLRLHPNLIKSEVEPRSDQFVVHLIFSCVVCGAAASSVRVQAARSSPLLFSSHNLDSSSLPPV